MLLVFSLVLFSLIRRIILKKIDAFFLIIYISIIIVWPYSDIYYVSRFLFPVFPVFLFYLWESIAALNFPYTYARHVLFAVILTYTIFTVLPGSYHISKLAFTSLGKELDPYRRHRSWILSKTYNDAVNNALFVKNLFGSLSALKKVIPPDDCIYSIQTALVMLHTHRISGILPEPGQPDTTFDRETGDCKYMIAMGVVDKGYAYPAYYPLMRLHDKDRYRVTPILPDNNKIILPLIYLIKRNY